MPRNVSLPFLFFCLFVPSLLCSQRLEFRLIPFEKDGLWGYVNSKKEVIIEPQFEAAFPTYNSCGRVKNKGKFGFIDNQGNWIVKPKFSHAEDFSWGIAQVRKGKKQYYIKTNGKKNKQIVGHCGRHSGCLLKMRSPNYQLFKANNGKWGVTFQKLERDEDRKLIKIPDTLHAQFDTIVHVGHGLIYFQKENKIAFSYTYNFDRGAKNVLDKLDFKYDEIKAFPCENCCEGNRNLIAVRSGALWGVNQMYHELTTVFEPQYLNITPFLGYFSLVEYAPNKWGYIDSYGNEYFNF